MNNIIKFIYDNYLNIIFVTLVMFLFLTISQLKWNFDPVIPSPTLIQQVTLETMENYINNNNNNNNNNKDNDFLTINPIDGFCESYLGDASNLEQACNRLTKNRCLKTSCCVYSSNNKCVAGSKDGPTYKTDKQGNKIPYDYYYHKSIKY